MCASPLAQKEASSFPPCPGELQRNPCCWGHGTSQMGHSSGQGLCPPVRLRTWEMNLSCWEPHPQLPSSGDVRQHARPAQTVVGAQEIGAQKCQELLYRTQEPPLPPFRLPPGSVLSLTPAGHPHSSTHSLPSSLPCARPLSPSSSCSPPGPLCPCQTLHLSSHLWWEPLGKSPKFTQSIMPSCSRRPKEWGGSPGGSLRGGVRVQLRWKEAWA